MRRHRNNHRPGRPVQGRWKFIRAAVRSGLRRYPREFYESFNHVPSALAHRTDLSVHHIGEHALAAVWLGHGTVLARLGRVNILVDPVFSDRIGARLGPYVFGPKRKMKIPVPPDTLPRVDLVMVTHAHYDHLDKPSLRLLARKETTVVAPVRTRRLIPDGFKEVVELAPGGSFRFGGVRIAAIGPRHWGARSFFDRHRGHNSYLAEAPRGRILFAGDTAHTDAFEQKKGIDLAVFGIGAYDPWEHMHATPEQVWQMFDRMGGRNLLPVHHSTFELSDEPLEEPMHRLLRASQGQTGRVVQVHPGQVWVAPGG